MVKNTIKAMWQAIIRTFAFISKEIRLILHQPRLVFSFILGPFLILLIFGLGYRNAPRTLNTLFVVPEGSDIEGYVEEFAGSLGSRINFAGITHDAKTADDRLRNDDVDLVVVTPFDPSIDWENDEQSTFSLFHNEIDPLEETYIQVVGQRYAEEINRQVLLTAVSQSQKESSSWYEEVREARASAGAVRQAFATGDQVRARESAELLKQDLDLLTLTLGTGAALVAGLEEANGASNTTENLLRRLDTLQTKSGELVNAGADDSLMSEGEATAAEVEASLEEMEGLLQTFQEMDATVLVTPFRSESLNITQEDIQPMHFYVPAVIALLLQHLAVTIGGMSVVREKLGGAMELFQVAPVTALEILVGKFSGYLLLMGFLAAILTVLMIFGLQVPQLGQWGSYALVILALLLASLGIGFNISISARSDSQAIQYGMLILLASIFFCGFFLPLYRLAPPVRIVSWLLPATYGTVLLQDVMLRGQSPQILLLLALFLFAVVLFFLAWFRLHRQMIKQ